MRKTRYNAGRDNKSLDASGTSALVIDNLSVNVVVARRVNSTVIPLRFKTGTQQRSVVMQLNDMSRRVLARAIGYGMF